MAYTTTHGAPSLQGHFSANSLVSAFASNGFPLLLNITNSIASSITINGIVIPASLTVLFSIANQAALTTLGQSIDTAAAAANVSKFVTITQYIPDGSQIIATLVATNTILISANSVISDISFRNLTNVAVTDLHIGTTSGASDVLPNYPLAANGGSGSSLDTVSGDSLNKRTFNAATTLYLTWSSAAVITFSFSLKTVG